MSLLPFDNEKKKNNQDMMSFMYFIKGKEKISQDEERELFKYK